MSVYETSITNPKKQLEFYKQLSEQLQQENKQLKEDIKDVDIWNKLYNEQFDKNRKLEDNWSELKEWLKKELGDRINPNKDKWLTGVYDAYRETIDKMQELERGVSDVED